MSNATHSESHITGLAVITVRDKYQIMMANTTVSIMLGMASIFFKTFYEP